MGKKYETENVCFDFPYDFFCKNFVLKRIRRNIITHGHKSSGKVTDILFKILIEVKFS
jgi:hypothetical protein